MTPRPASLRPWLAVTGRLAPAYTWRQRHEGEILLRVGLSVAVRQPMARRWRWVQFQADRL